MNQPLQPLENDLASLGKVWAGALPAFGRLGAGADVAQLDMESMSDAGLMGTVDALGQLVRDTEALMVRAAGEVARRSPADLGKDGLAKRQGFQNPARLVAASTGSSVAGAAKLVQVGKATAPRQSLIGERMPATHPHVAQAIGEGGVSVDAASLISTMLDRVALRADPEQAAAVEQILAQKAAELPHDLLVRMVREAEARLDQDGIAPREDELRAGRSLHMREDANGMVHLSAHLDPESAGPVKAAIEAIVTNTIRSHKPECAGPADQDSDVPADQDGAMPAASPADQDGAVPADGPVVTDDRSIPQMQADALVMITRHVLGCTRMPQAPSMTLVVRTDLNTLTDGLGHGTIDGLTQPVSAGTIRKMAATAGLIPAVFGGQSLPLDVGRDNRLFTWGQRLALAERDGGCACCGIDVAYTEAHHIHWWKRDAGPTDLTNGVLLCPPCHTRMHHDGWAIQVRKGQVWFIPPPHVDPNQKPRLGGKARFALPALNLPTVNDAT